MEFRGELLGLLNFNLRYVVLLSNVFFQIEELNRPVFQVFEQFVIAEADSPTRTLHAVIAVVGKMPINGTSVHFLALHQGSEALPVDTGGFMLHTSLLYTYDAADDS